MILTNTRPIGCPFYDNFEAQEPSAYQLDVCSLLYNICLENLHYVFRRVRVVFALLWGQHAGVK